MDNNQMMTNNLISDYCVLDLETTDKNPYKARICEIAIVRIRDNKKVKEYQTLVNPECVISKEATEKNNITNDMVKKELPFSSIADEVMNFIGDDILLGYNIGQFDVPILLKEIFNAKGKSMEYRYIDIFTEISKARLGLEDNKLTTLCEHYAIDIEGAHRALKDCYMTFECYPMVINELFPDGLPVKTKNTNDIEKSLDKIKELCFVVNDIIKEGRLNTKDCFRIKEWLDKNTNLAEKDIYDNVRELIVNTIENNLTNDDALTEAFDLLNKYCNPIECYSSEEVIDTLQGKHICLTGNFENVRENIESLIKEVGAKVDSKIIKATDYLIVGNYGSDKWKNGSYGTKVQDAVKRITNNNSIVMMKESFFVPKLEAILERIESDNKTDFDQIWKDNVQCVIDNLIEENELPKNSLRLRQNNAKKGDEITSYSLCISGFEYPVSNNSSVPLLNFKHNPLKDNRIMDIVCSKDYFDKSICPEDADFKTIKNDGQNVFIRIRKDSKNLPEFISKLISKAVDNFVLNTSTFGCCSKYVECSDAKKCLHENKLYSKSCFYRKNLENGLIFYGKNAN